MFLATMALRSGLPSGTVGRTDTDRPECDRRRGTTAHPHWESIPRNPALSVVLIIANPDLPERFTRDAAIAEANPESYYGQGAEGSEVGYIDYPFLET
jgi:hypothetical protein